MAVSAKDIVRELGLSQAAVSLALWGRPGIEVAGTGIPALHFKRRDNLTQVAEIRLLPCQVYIV